MKVLSVLDGNRFQTVVGILGYSTVGLLFDEKRKILFDCGQRGCAVQLRAALNAQGLTPADITHVVISHLHFDHVGNLPLFEKAEVLLSEAEWKSAGEKPDEWHCRQTCAYLRERGNYSFVREGDRLADGVSVLELPGHTRGMIGIRCSGREDTADKTIIFCSDAIKNRYELWEGIPLMSADQEQSRSTVERICREADLICPGHDCMLDPGRPCHRETFSVRVYAANGAKRQLLLP